MNDMGWNNYPYSPLIRRVIFEQLVDAGLRPCEIAERTGDTAKTVYRLANQLKLKFGREYVPEAERAERLKLYRQGMSDTEIGKLLCVSRYAIRGWRKKHGLKPNYMSKRRIVYD